MFYENILKQTGWNAEECLFVGDSFDDDIQGPQSVGMKAVFINRKKIKNFELLKLPDFVIYSMDELLDVVERENISRNIHNSVGHSITAAIMTLDAADMLYDVNPYEARKRMNDANNRIRVSLESIRRALRVLDDEKLLTDSLEIIL